MAASAGEKVNDATTVETSDVPSGNQCHSRNGCAASSPQCLGQEANKK